MAIGRARYDAKILLSKIAGHRFPRATQSILHAIDTLVAGTPAARIHWPHQRASLEYYLPKRATSGPHGAGKHRAPYAVPKPCCSACIVYRLFEDLISIEVREDAYFRGIHSNHFLTAYVGFRDILVSAAKVSRTHVLYRLSTM